VTMEPKQESRAVSSIDKPVDESLFFRGSLDLFGGLSGRPV
jgi:hypothetical protein